MRRALALLLFGVLASGAGAGAGEPCSTAPASSGCPDLAPPAAVVHEPAGPPSPPALAAPLSATPRVDEGTPSLAGALLRLVGAVVVLALLMAAAVVGYRRLVTRVGARRGILAWVTGGGAAPDADVVRVGARRYLGARESVAVIHVEGERFLVGITAIRISLLARLEPAASAVEPPAPDFTEALARAAAPRTPVGAGGPHAEPALRAAIELSRARLARVTQLSVVPGDRRG
jgi:hypothetical protein